MALDPEFEKTYQTAQECFDEKRWDEAERLYLQLLDRNPNGYADVFNRLGLIYSEKGLLERAAGYFVKALALNPQYTEASLNLSVTYNELKWFEKAEDVFGRATRVIQSDAVSLDPFIRGKLANEHVHLGDSYYNLGLYDEALYEFQRAALLRPNFADIHTKVGVTFREKGDLDKAIISLIKAKTVNPLCIGMLGVGEQFLGVSFFNHSSRIHNNHFMSGLGNNAKVV